MMTMARQVSRAIALVVVTVGFGRISAQNETCPVETTDVTSPGNGMCNYALNIDLCDYDGGDCCECTCEDGDVYSCGNGGWGFNCLDPSAASPLYGCEEVPPSVSPCASDSQREWVVETSAEALALAEAVQCSEGEFHVEWRGSVAVGVTISIVEGTFLNVTGVGSSAVVDGSNSTRPFTVVNASLHVANVNISYGGAIIGGAVAAVGSSLTFDRTAFVGNDASVNGGALFVSDGSMVVFDDEAVFVGNSAGVDGGAFYTLGGSTVSFLGDALFLDSVAVDEGGAVFCDNSDVSWGGRVIFENNSAGDSGGALNIDDVSSISFFGDALFSDNHADWGAAIRTWSESNVSFGGKATFTFNNASSFGGAISIWDSKMSFAGDALFFENVADGSGGAMSISGYADVSWSGNATFVGNIADGSGGALEVSDGARVSFYGQAFFTGNYADLDGGALCVEEEGNVSFHGDAIISNNTSDSNGGAAFVSDTSVLTWRGKTTVSENQAYWDGGGISVYSARVSWSGSTTFATNNVAAPYDDEGGGAISATTDADVSWSGETTFVDNRASVSQGGALRATGPGCHVYWSGKTSFIGNEARVGGAIFIDNEATIDCGGQTTFMLNHAVSHGGAVGTEPNPYDKNTLNLTCTTHFANNTCGGSGAGITILEGLDATFGESNIMFSGNSAGVAGGGVFISGVGVGPVFKGGKFISNLAGVGGGVYAVASGTTTEYGGDERRTSFIGCEFVGNTAAATGGALDSAAGREFIQETSFVGNRAGVGGALRLAGTASIENCSFVDNVAGDGGGPAVSNIGYISSLTASSFVDNVLSCEAGTFLDWYESSDDLFGAVCDGCPEPCGDCDFGDSQSVPRCKTVVEHSSSPNGSVTVEGLTIKRGYWRATNTSLSVFACYKSDACLGGLTGAAGYCAEGYEGPYCSICSEGYTADLGFACDKCSDSTGAVALAAVLCVIVIFLVIAVVSFLLSGEKEATGKGVVDRVLRRVPLQSIKIVIVVWQILTQFASVANVTYPDVYEDFLNGVDLLNFDLTWVIGAGCIVDIDFHDRLLASTFGPIVAGAAIGCTYAVAMHRNRGSEDALRNVRHKHLSAVLLLTFLVYSSVSSVLFQMFSCDPLDDDKTYLRADYRIECDSSKHRGLQIYACFMIAVYPVGIPAFYAALLFPNRDVLIAADREDVPRLSATSELWEPYRPSRYYYEVIECARRILLAGLIVFIYPNTAAQIAVTIVITSVFSTVAEVLSPYASLWDTWISRIGHAIVFLSMYVALLLKVDVADERASSQKAFEAILVAAHVCLILAVIVEGVVVAWSMRNEKPEEPQPSVCPKRMDRWKGGASLMECDALDGNRGAEAAMCARPAPVASRSCVEFEQQDEGFGDNKRQAAAI